MNVRRREFIHLLGAHGIGLGALATGCGDDGLAPQSGSSGTSGSSGGMPPGGGSTGLASSSSGLVDTTAGDSSSGSDGSTGEPTECNEDTWWLADNYGPVEESEASDLVVEGALPPSLNGLYVRNGPNPQQGCTEHWFLGDGMVHGIALSGGRAQSYRSRYIQTSLLGGDGSGDPFNLVDHHANTSLVWHGGRLMALEETGLPYELDPSDLSTIGPWDFGGKVAAPMTAHPKIDPNTGEMIFFGYELLQPRAQLQIIDSAGTLVRHETVPLSAPVMMHDFQVTANYIVFMDLPVLFDFDLAIAGETLPFTWTPKHGARFGIMPRNGGPKDVVWIETDVGFAFHTFNAHETPDGNIVLDAVWYPEIWVESPSEISGDSSLIRFTLDPARRVATRETIDERQHEFPRIDPRRQGLTHRYGYAIAYDPRVSGRPPYPPTIVRKYDFSTGAVQSHAMADGLHLGELLFVPDSPEAGEDEGWLVGVGHDPKADRSQLVVLDATDLRAGPVARVMVPGRVPYGFHGAWVPSA